MATLGQPKQHVPVFVGSTYEDLREYRAAVRDALHHLETIVRGMEYFGSKPGSPKEECLKAVQSCRAYIGIFAMRYGSIDEETGKSMTHLEYEEATRLGLPILVYLIDGQNQAVLPKHVETGDNAKLLNTLKAELKKKYTVSFFTTPEDLAKRVAQDLPPILRDIGVAIEPEPKELVTTDAEETLSRFRAQPTKYSGREITADHDSHQIAGDTMAEDVKWLCDFCGEAITKVEDGWVEWIEISRADGTTDARDLRLVHHRPASPLKDSPKACQLNSKAEYKKDKGSISDLSLEYFLGPNGLMYLLSKVQHGPGPSGIWIEMIKRLHIPGYELARRHFDRALRTGVIENDSYPGFYEQHQIKAVLAKGWPDDISEMITPAPKLNLRRGFTKDELKQLLSSVDDADGHHVMWVDYLGNFYISRIPEELTPIGWAETIKDKLKFRYETLMQGNGYVGFESAADEGYVSETYNDLLRDWKAGSTGYIDY